MKKIYISFIFLFSAILLQAQSLAEITAQKDFALRTPKTQEESSLTEETAPLAQTQQETLLQVNKLPDIKLNEDILRKSVLSYDTNPSLQEAFEYYRQGNLDKALISLDSEGSSEAYANMALIYLQK